MSPPQATYAENGAASTANASDSTPSTKAPLEPGLSEKKARGQIMSFPSPPKFDDKMKERAYLKGRLAAAFRIFGKVRSSSPLHSPSASPIACCSSSLAPETNKINLEQYGFDEGVAGHITLRDPVEPDTFWVNPFGVSFALIRASDLIRVNEEGEVVDGGDCRLLNTAAFMIHSAIHQARPDVIAAAHSHTVYGRAFCTLGRTLDTLTQDACAFHNVGRLLCRSDGSKAP